MKPTLLIDASAFTRKVISASGGNYYYEDLKQSVLGAFDQFNQNQDSTTRFLFDNEQVKAQIERHVEEILLKGNVADQERVDTFLAASLLSVEDAKKKVKENPQNAYAWITHSNGRVEKLEKTAKEVKESPNALVLNLGPSINVATNEKEVSVAVQQDISLSHIPKVIKEEEAVKLFAQAYATRKLETKNWANMGIGYDDREYSSKEERERLEQKIAGKQIKNVVIIDLNNVSDPQRLGEFLSNLQRLDNNTNPDNPYRGRNIFCVVGDLENIPGNIQSLLTDVPLSPTIKLVHNEDITSELSSIKSQYRVNSIVTSQGSQFFMNQKMSSPENTSDFPIDCREGDRVSLEKLQQKMEGYATDEAYQSRTKGDIDPVEYIHFSAIDERGQDTWNILENLGAELGSDETIHGMFKREHANFEAQESYTPERKKDRGVENLKLLFTQLVLAKHNNNALNTENAETRVSVFQLGRLFSGVLSSLVTVIGTPLATLGKGDALTNVSSMAKAVPLFHFAVDNFALSITSARSTSARINTSPELKEVLSESFLKGQEAVMKGLQLQKQKYDHKLVVQGGLMSMMLTYQELDKMGLVRREQTEDGSERLELLRQGAKFYRKDNISIGITIGGSLLGGISALTAAVLTIPGVLAEGSSARLADTVLSAGISTGLISGGAGIGYSHKVEMDKKVDQDLRADILRNDKLTDEFKKFLTNNIDGLRAMQDQVMPPLARTDQEERGYVNPIYSGATSTDVLLEMERIPRQTVVDIGSADQQFGPETEVDGKQAMVDLVEKGGFKSDTRITATRPYQVLLDLNSYDHEQIKELKEYFERKEGVEVHLVDKPSMMTNLDLFNEGQTKACLLFTGDPTLINKFDEVPKAFEITTTVSFEDHKHRISSDLGNLTFIDATDFIDEIDQEGKLSAQEVFRTVKAEKLDKIAQIHHEHLKARELSNLRANTLEQLENKLNGVSKELAQNQEQANPKKVEFEVAKVDLTQALKRFSDVRESLLTLELKNKVTQEIVRQLDGLNQSAGDDINNYLADNKETIIEEVSQSYYDHFLREQLVNPNKNIEGGEISINNKELSEDLAKQIQSYLKLEQFDIADARFSIEGSPEPFVVGTFNSIEYEQLRASANQVSQTSELCNNLAQLEIQKELAKQRFVTLLEVYLDATLENQNAATKHEFSFKIAKQLLENPAEIEVQNYFENSQGLRDILGEELIDNFKMKREELRDTQGLGENQFWQEVKQTEDQVMARVQETVDSIPERFYREEIDGPEEASKTRIEIDNSDQKINAAGAVTIGALSLANVGMAAALYVNPEQRALQPAKSVVGGIGLTTVGVGFNGYQIYRHVVNKSRNLDFDYQLRLGELYGKVYREALKKSGDAKIATRVALIVTEQTVLNPSSDAIDMDKFIRDKKNKVAAGFATSTVLSLASVGLRAGSEFTEEQSSNLSGGLAVASNIAHVGAFAASAAVNGYVAMYSDGVTRAYGQALQAELKSKIRDLDQRQGVDRIAEETATLLREKYELTDKRPSNEVEKSELKRLVTNLGKKLPQDGQTDQNKQLLGEIQETYADLASCDQRKITDLKRKIEELINDERLKEHIYFLKSAKYCINALERHQENLSALQESTEKIYESNFKQLSPEQQTKLYSDLADIAMAKRAPNQGFTDEFFAKKRDVLVVSDADGTVNSITTVYDDTTGGPTTASMDLLRGAFVNPESHKRYEANSESDLGENGFVVLTGSSADRAQRSFSSLIYEPDASMFVLAENGATMLTPGLNPALDVLTFLPEIPKDIQTEIEFEVAKIVDALDDQIKEVYKDDPEKKHLLGNDEKGVSGIGIEPGKRHGMTFHLTNVKAMYPKATDQIEAASNNIEATINKIMNKYPNTLGLFVQKKSPDWKELSSVPKTFAGMVLEKQLIGALEKQIETLDEVKKELQNEEESHILEKDIAEKLDALPRVITYSGDSGSDEDGHLALKKLAEKINTYKEQYAKDVPKTTTLHFRVLNQSPQIAARETNVPDTASHADFFTLGGTEQHNSIITSSERMHQLSDIKMALLKNDLLKNEVGEVTNKEFNKSNTPVVLLDMKEPTLYIPKEKFKNDDAMKAFFSSPAILKHNPKIVIKGSQPIEMTHYDNLYVVIPRASESGVDVYDHNTRMLEQIPTGEPMPKFTTMNQEHYSTKFEPLEAELKALLRCQNDQGMKPFVQRTPTVRNLSRLKSTNISSKGAGDLSTNPAAASASDIKEGQKLEGLKNPSVEISLQGKQTIAKRQKFKAEKDKTQKNGTAKTSARRLNKKT